MSLTLIEWLLGAVLLAVLLLLVVARIQRARRHCAPLRDMHWLTGTVPVSGADACPTCDGGGAG